MLRGQAFEYIHHLLGAFCHEQTLCSFFLIIFFWLFHDSVFPDYGNVDRILSIAPTRHQILMLLVPHPL